MANISRECNLGSKIDAEICGQRHGYVVFGRGQVFH